MGATIGRPAKPAAKAKQPKATADKSVAMNSCELADITRPRFDQSCTLLFSHSAQSKIFWLRSLTCAAAAICVFYGRRKVAPSLRCRRQRRQDHMDSRPLPSPPSSLIHATRRRRPRKCCDRELKRPAFRFAPLRSTWAAAQQPMGITDYSSSHSSSRGSLGRVG